MVSDLLNISTTKAEKCCCQAQNGYLKAAMIKMFMLITDHVHVKRVTCIDEPTEKDHLTAKHCSVFQLVVLVVQPTT